MCDIRMIEFKFEINSYFEFELNLFFNVKPFKFRVHTLSATCHLNAFLSHTLSLTVVIIAWFTNACLVYYTCIIIRYFI